MEQYDFNLLDKMSIYKDQPDAESPLICMQNQDNFYQMCMEDSCTNSLQLLKLETYNSFQNSQDLFSQFLLPAQPINAGQQLTSLMSMQSEEIKKLNQQNSIKNNSQQDKPIEKAKKTKTIQKDTKKKNKKEKQKLYNRNSSERKRIAKPRGNNTNNQPKIFGAIVHKILKKYLQLDMKLDKSRYSYTARYYLHSAFSLVQGENCVQKFFSQLDAGMLQKYISRKGKGKQADFLKIFKRSVETLKEYSQTGNIENLRNSFKIIYNYQTSDSNDLKTYESNLKQGYQKIKKIRQVYDLPNFFD